MTIEQLRDINQATCIVENIDLRDYPDFCDAFVSYAEWSDGTPLTERQLDQLHDHHPDFVHEIVSDVWMDIA